MKYPGGKGKCYQHIINLMPPHDTYIESHLGGGAVLRNKRPAKRNIGIDLDPNVIQHWQEHYGDQCELIEGDALSFLASFTYTGNELIYADPPYLSSTRRRARVYPCDYTHEQHELLLKQLQRTPCQILLSGYDSDLYNDLLNGWNKVTFSAKTHVDIREECVWFNFERPVRLHDASHTGHNFRDRQTNKRRQGRLHERIKNMDPIERHEFIRWINTTYGSMTGEQ